MGMSGIDWDAGETHFIKETGPRVTLRRYASMTPDLAWTGYQSVAYDKLRDVAKTRLWMSKRAQHLRESNPDMVMDSELMYGIVMNAIVDDADAATPADLARLVDMAMKLQDMILSQRPPEMDDNEERMSRDDVLDMILTHEPVEAEDLLKGAIDALGDNGQASG